MYALVMILVCVAIVSVVFAVRKVGLSTSNSDNSAIRAEESPKAEVPHGDNGPREWVDPNRETFHQKALKEVDHGPRAAPAFPALVREAELREKINLYLEVREAADTEFESGIAEVVPIQYRDKAFFNRVAGTSHRNDDHTSRAKIIDECSALESLDLISEPDNRFDPNAIAVRRTTGEQLGYLESRLAGEVTRDQSKHGPRWIAVFRHKNFNPETDRVVGATIYLIRVSEDFARR